MLRRRASAALTAEKVQARRPNALRIGPNTAPIIVQVPRRCTPRASRDKFRKFRLTLDRIRGSIPVCPLSPPLQSGSQNPSRSCLGRQCEETRVRRPPQTFPLSQWCSRVPEILPRICVQRGQPGTCVGDRKISRPDCKAEFAPIQRHGYGSARPRARRIRRDRSRAASIAQIVASPPTSRPLRASQVPSSRFLTATTIN